MGYEFTRHALYVMHERNIPVEWVELVLHGPDDTVSDPMDSALEHRMGIIKEYGGRVLRVVVNAKVEPVRVVTVYFDRKMKGKL